MSKIIFLMIIAGLCFSQSTESIPSCNFSLKIPRSMFVKPINQGENLILHNLYVHSLQFNTTSFNTMLMMQVEGESLQPKTSFWKQAGIYGLEFVGAGMGTILPTYTGFMGMSGGYGGEPNLGAGFRLYAFGNALLGGTTTWATGGLFRQRGSWLKSAIGGGIGSLFGGFMCYIWGGKTGFISGVGWGSFYIAPPLCAVIGYNF